MISILDLCRRGAVLAAAATLSLASLAAAVVPVADDAAVESQAASGPLATAAPLSPLALDTASATTDLSINTPTGWWFYTGISAAQVGIYLSNNCLLYTSDAADEL